MKKIITLILCLSIALIALSGCNLGKKSASVKTGLAVISSVEKSKDAGDENGLAETDSIVVAVTVGNDGKIVNCVIDTAQTKINFSKEGKLVTDINATFKTKQELGVDYGMKKASSISKEWFEQANALAEYVKGKTIAQVKGIAVNAEGAPSGAELTSSVTISISGLVNAIEKAVGNAKDIGAKSGDKLGLGVSTNIAKSTDATTDKAGLAQAYSSYTATTFDASGKITSCIIDASQTNVNFDTTGKITTNLSDVQKTKNELGQNYGMAKASSIGKEWDQQAAALANYVKGKTIAEVKGIAVNAEGVPTASDLTSSVTIHIGDYQTIIEKASKSAK